MCRRPHKCPDPKPRITTANNFVTRCARRAIGYQCKSMDRKFIHSRFCPVQTLRLPTDENDGFFTCARFMVSFYFFVHIYLFVVWLKMICGYKFFFFCKLFMSWIKTFLMYLKKLDTSCNVMFWLLPAVFFTGT